jgi:hypothetical protein
VIQTILKSHIYKEKLSYELFGISQCRTNYKQLDRGDEEGFPQKPTTKWFFHVVERKLVDIKRPGDALSDTPKTSSSNFNIYNQHPVSQHTEINQIKTFNTKWAIPSQQPQSRSAGGLHLRLDCI